MPARLDLTPEQMLERVREQGRARVKRYRERRNATGNATEPHKKESSNVTPSQTLPFGEKTLNGGEWREVEAILAPFEPRGYKHTPAFLAKMAAKYPALDLELEALKLADWLEQPKNAKALCSRARIDNWLGKAEDDRRRPRTNGSTNGHYHQPVSQQGRNPGPADLPKLEADMERVPPAPRRAGTLKEKLAQARGRT